jgi:DNA (cytosine-5)-methyltransferase 1
MYTVGSLFTGIGGLDLGLERAGMTVRWQVERDPWCQRVLAKHWPDVPRYKNVEDVGVDLEPVDLICGGFPCQPVSQAGQQKGTDDDRWLWPEFQRIVGLLRPRYVLVENVPGLFTANGGHAFGEVIGDLADSGYDCEWTVLSAADVGAPHLRKRVWIVAHADSDGHNYADSGLGRDGPEGSLGQKHEYGKIVRNDPSLAHADSEGLEGRKLLPKRPSERAVGETGLDDRRIFGGPVGGDWAVEPDVGRVAHGIPKRVDRLRGLGNAVVPQCVEWIGRRIMEHL